MSLLSIGEIIELGDVSTYLSLKYKDEGKLFGAKLDGISPKSIAIVTDALRWQNESFPNDESTRGVANYLYWMCGKFQIEAQFIIQGVGGGIVSVLNPFATPNPLEFTVDGSSVIADGGTSATFTEFIGYNILFMRNNIPQSTVNNGGSYFSWNKTNGSFSISQAAYTGELFQIYPFI